MYYRKYIYDISRDLRSQNVDIAHIWNFSQFAPVVRAAKPNIKIVLHMQCEWLTQLEKKEIEERLKHVDMIIGCSDYITNKICERFPDFSDRGYTVLNGVDADHFREGPIDNSAHKRTERQDNIKRLLFVGRVAPEKGVHILVDSLQQVIEQHPQIALNIVGPLSNTPYEFIVMISDDEKVVNLAPLYRNGLRQIDYFAKLQERLSPQVARHVNFVGPVSHSELTHYYQTADLLINPSLSEAFGMTLVEAMASGVPVLASRVGGMTEIVDDGKTGLLVDAGDANGLAEAIIYLLEDYDLRLSMARAGRRRVLKYFTWDGIAARMLGLYGQL
jgi:glycosyltransferase involved in cell wall biosynthesis